MKAVLVLGALECLLAAPAYLAMRRRADGTILALLALTAPLELYRTSIAGFSVSLFRLSLAAGVVLLLMEVVRKRPGALEAARWTVQRPVVLVYAGLALLIEVGLALHPVNAGYSGRLLGIAVVGVAAVVVIALLARRFPVEVIARTFAFGACLPVIAACWQTIGLRAGWPTLLPFLRELPVSVELDEKARDAIGALGELGDRAKGTFADPNHFGAYLALTLVIAFGLLATATFRRRTPDVVGFSALTLAISCAVVLSFSRSAWLAATVGLLALVVMLVPVVAHLGFQRRAAMVAGALLGAAVIAAVPMAPKVTDRLDSSQAINVASDRTHEQTLRYALRRFGDRPLDGIGPGGLGAELEQGPRASGAHSTYATVAAELGIVGLLATLAAAFLVLQLIYRAYRRASPGAEAVLPAAALAAYTGFVVTNAIYDLWWDDFHWLALGLVLSQNADPR